MKARIETVLWLLVPVLLGALIGVGAGKADNDRADFQIRCDSIGGTVWYDARGDYHCRRPR